MAAEHEDQDAAEQDAARQAPPAASGTGGISIGVMTGGAAAAGENARAEDRAHRAAAPPPPPYAGPPLPAPGAGIGVGVMTGGAVAAGRGARAVDASTQYVAASAELAAAVGVLREQLRVLAPSEETAEVDAELAGAEREIAEGGLVRRSRLQWLRDRLDLGATAAAGLASAAAVVQACLELLG
ncbi:hypothetical protein [Streptomyces sp. NBC_01198]|uniref:hypothetical protein n=1 Tax=Streptomyces sp. NBC_01198 TaxID=2903769 RepID=UPI002E0DAC98|nr:hypothetical protein OG702_23720 [Streptomyces sp. NBC_01198]